MAAGYKENAFGLTLSKKKHAIQGGGLRWTKERRLLHGERMDPQDDAYCSLFNSYEQSVFGMFRSYYLM